MENAREWEEIRAQEGVEVRDAVDVLVWKTCEAVFTVSDDSYYDNSNCRH